MSTPRAKLKIPSTIRLPSTTPSGSHAGRLMAMSSGYVKRRSLVYAAGFAVITISGALIGATLRSGHQAEEKKVIKEKVQVDVGEQIALLEETKLSLLQRKRQLERKIDEVRERQVKDEEKIVERERLRAKGDELKKQLAMERGRS